MKLISLNNIKECYIKLDEKIEYSNEEDFMRLLNIKKIIELNYNGFDVNIENNKKIFKYKIKYLENDIER